MGRVTAPAGPLEGILADFQGSGQSTMGPRQNPAQRFCWGEEEQRNERVFTLLGGNEGYGACDDEKQEKGEGAQAAPLRPQMPAVRAFSQGSNRAL